MHDPTHGSQRYMCKHGIYIRLGEWEGEAYTEVEVSPRNFTSSIRRTL